MGPNPPVPLGSRGVLNLLAWLLEKDRPVWVPGHCNLPIAWDCTSPCVQIRIGGRGWRLRCPENGADCCPPAGFTPFPALELNLSSLDERVYVDLFLSEPFPEDPRASQNHQDPCSEAAPPPRPRAAGRPMLWSVKRSYPGILELIASLWV